MNTPNQAKAREEAAAAPPPRAPENETTLAIQALTLGENVLNLQLQGSEIYGILHRSRAMTEQSDFYRMQFKGFARTEGRNWIMCEEEETKYDDNINCAWVRVDHPSRSITLGPRTGIVCNDMTRGTGLDTFLFANAVSWVKGIYPDYSVSPGMVNLPASASEDDKRRKNAFFARQGFDFEWKDETQRSALFFKDKASRLIGVCDVDTIHEIGGEAMLHTLAHGDQERFGLEQRIAVLEALNETAQQRFNKERSTTLILTGVLTLVMVIALIAAW